MEDVTSNAKATKLKSFIFKFFKITAKVFNVLH